MCDEFDSLIRKGYSDSYVLFIYFKHFNRFPGTFQQYPRISQTEFARPCFKKLEVFVKIISYQLEGNARALVKLGLVRKYSSLVSSMLLQLKVIC